MTSSFVPVMTSNTTPSGLAFSSSSQFSGSIWYHPWMAFEPLTGYGHTWIAGSGDTPQYIGYKTTGNYKLDSIKYTAVVHKGMPFPPPGINTIEGAPTNFKVQGSNNTTDGSNGTWIDLATFTNVTWNVDSPTQTFNVASNTSYSSFRIYMTSINTNWAQCEYLELIQSPVIRKPYTFTPDTEASAGEVNADFDTLYTYLNNPLSSISDKTDSYTLLDLDNTSIIRIDSALDVTLNVPNTLSVGFSCLVKQVGVGKITIVGTGGMVVQSYSLHTKTAGVNAIASLLVDAVNCVTLAGECTV